MSNANGAANIAERLLDTLEQEGDALTTLADEFTRQLDAVRNQQLQQLEESTDEANVATSRLHRAQQARKRQMRLLGRVLNVGEEASLRELAAALRPHDVGLSNCLQRQHRVLRDQAETAQQHCEELEFALRYAVNLSREMLGLLQGTDDDAQPAGAYTASGGSTPASSSSLVNEIG